MKKDSSKQSAEMDEWQLLEKKRQDRVIRFQKWQKAVGRGPAVNLKDAMKTMLKKSGINFMKKNSGVLQIWNNVVGEEVAIMAVPASFKAGVLTVEVANSALLHELAQFHKEELLESLRQACPNVTIRNIRFKLGVEKK